MQNFVRRIWFPRMCEYGFKEGEDFNPVKIDRVQQEGGRMVSRMVDDAILSLDMAKEICMIQRNEKGKLARQYFLALERDWNSPEKVMSRALRYAEQELKQVRALNSALTVDNQIMKPKADYFDELVERNTLTNFRETAKELGVPPRKFVRFLMDKKYIYRDKKGKLRSCSRPTAPDSRQRPRSPEAPALPRRPCVGTACPYYAVATLRSPMQSAGSPWSEYLI